MTTTTRAADRGLSGQEQSPSPRTAAQAAADAMDAECDAYRAAQES